MRLSRPVYESLPWFYLGCGTLALGVGYRLRTGIAATVVSVSGLLGIIAAVAVWLRRRDHRERSAEYDGGDSSR